MTHDPLACADLIASRRYAYAMTAAADEDWNAAAQVLEQALERAPDWAPAWFALAEARREFGDVDGAAQAFRSTLGDDPADAQGAAARLALIGRGDKPSAPPEAYMAFPGDRFGRAGLPSHLRLIGGFTHPHLFAACSA